MESHEDRMLKDVSEVERMKKIYFNACEEFDIIQLDQFTEAIEGSAHTESVLILKGNLGIFRTHKLKDNDFHAIFLSLQSDYSCIKSIDLSFNSLCSDVCISIGKALVKNKSIKFLILSMCDIDVDGCYAISKGLEYNACLEKLVLNGNYFGSEGCAALASVLQINETLKSLDISSTDQTSQSLVPLCTVLTSNASLQEVNLSRTIPYTDSVTLTDHFSKMLTINITLFKLTLSKCGITDDGACSLAYYLKNNMALKFLDLSSNEISSSGAKGFADLLSRNNTLQALSLASNRIGDIGMIAISEVLACRNVGLKKLWVTNNSISDLGLCPLAAALSTNKTLTHLYIWGNHIEEKTCNAFQILCSGECPRLSPENVDVEPYAVDGINYLAETGHFTWSH